MGARAACKSIDHRDLDDATDLGKSDDFSLGTAGAPASKALAVERFDRTAGGAPVHMEDFAQVFGRYPNDKYRFRSYANIASVLWAEAGEDAVAELVRRLVLSVVIGNADMHLKN